jgi:alpha-galactosidase
LNNWEATYFNFNEAKLIELFDGARQLGVDMFLLDDGWFGNAYPRDSDKAGLGDWQENKTKLPNGIGKLVQEATNRGIKFGIWLEPEMVNPKSELYQKHPDWILRLPNRAENLARNQLVLDLTNPQVQDFVYSIVDDMLTKNPGVAYIKWDCNRSMTNAYSVYLKEKQSHLFIEYTRCLYKVLDRIRAKYPHLPIMLCSGGGGRTDYGALKYFTEFWPSDNTDGLERVFIQWGYSYFFPANTMAAHITSMGKGQSLKFRTDVAMAGRLGYDIRVNEFTSQELQFSQEAIKTYKRISDVIWQGDLYRIISPYDEPRAVTMYVSENKSKAVLFNYNLNIRRKDIFTRVQLQGLDAQKKYRLKEINLFPGTKAANPDNDKVFTGEYLMNIGLNLTPGKVTSLSSNVYEITEE